MSSFERKIRKKKNRELEKDLEEKITLFGLLPEECSSCLTHYDKADREMVRSWNVVIREKEKVVRLYCPACWSAARKMVKEVASDFSGKA